jgi:hypothetical protein
LQEKIAALQQRQARYAALQHELAASGETARSLTDPDSRPMMSGGRIEVCYNVQTAVDAQFTIKNDRTSASGRCALRPRCTRNKDGRKLTRWVDEHLLEQMAQSRPSEPGPTHSATAAPSSRRGSGQQIP